MSVEQEIEKQAGSGLLKALCPAAATAFAAKSGHAADDFISRLAGKINHDTIALVERNKDMLVDEASKQYLMLASWMLAAYRSYEVEIEDNVTRMDVIREVFIGTLGSDIRSYIKWRFDVDYDLAGEAYEKVTENFITRGLSDAFVYGEVKDSETDTTFTVSKCLFLDFFTRNGAPEVTQIMCAFDIVWANEFIEGPYNIDFARPTLMSKGDDICRFQFHKS